MQLRVAVQPLLCTNGNISGFLNLVSFGSGSELVSVGIRCSSTNPSSTSSSRSIIVKKFELQEVDGNDHDNPIGPLKSKNGKVQLNTNSQHTFALEEVIPNVSSGAIAANGVPTGGRYKFNVVVDDTGGALGFVVLAVTELPTG